ncbi:hypothetical protein [Streptosporangium vulgare]|uniref:hypothetical protein n=1 Tax=Streptosporangium vulgare TaxID=46190 RepID=UPI0031D88D69
MPNSTSGPADGVHHADRALRQPPALTAVVPHADLDTGEGDVLPVLEFPPERLVTAHGGPLGDGREDVAERVLALLQVSGLEFLDQAVQLGALGEECVEVAHRGAFQGR